MNFKTFSMIDCLMTIIIISFLDHQPLWLVVTWNYSIVMWTTDLNACDFLLIYFPWKQFFRKKSKIKIIKIFKYALYIGLPYHIRGLNNYNLMWYIVNECYNEVYYYEIITKINLKSLLFSKSSHFDVNYVEIFLIEVLISIYRNRKNWNKKHRHTEILNYKCIYKYLVIYKFYSRVSEMI